MTPRSGIYADIGCISVLTVNRFFRGVSCIFVGWLLAGACSAALGQQYPFLPVPGSPKGVTNLFQDSRGRIWLGGAQLSCFDGTRFFSLADYGLPKVTTYDIAEDPSGAIWIGAETGVYRFANGRVEEITKGVAVSVIAATPDVAVAAVGPPGRGLPDNASLVRIERTGSIWSAHTIMSLDSAGPLTLDYGGQLLYPWPAHGWYELRLADVVNWRPGTKLAATGHVVWKYPSAGPMRVLRDHSGCVWIGTDGQDTFDCGDGVWRQAPYDEAGVREYFRETSKGDMVLAGDNLLALGRPGNFRLARLANGLPLPTAVVQARDGTVWVGTPGGLFRFASPFELEYWSARDGVDVAWCLQRSGGNMYAGLDQTVAVLAKDRQHWQTLASFGKAGQVWNLLAMDDGTLLAALSVEGVAALRPSGTVVARMEAAHRDWYGQRLARTPDGKVWMGGLGLQWLERLGSRLIPHFHRPDTVPAGNFLGLQYEENTRKLWTCYNAGLVARSQDGSWRELTRKDGFTGGRLLVAGRPA
jgi:hypothetical protein